jgi:DNA-binding transcriptional LysR family regulator
MHPENAKPDASQAGAVPAAGFQRASLPRLELLRSFEASARTLSFTQAATELFLTQSAVSRQIQQLEGDLGVSLFERRHRALALTDAGRIMHRTIADCLERLRDATASVRAIAPIQHVAITTTPGFASLWLIPRLTQFTAGHPEVDVRISATLDVLDMERHGIDVSVRLRLIEGAEGRLLFEETVLPVCAPQLLHPPAPPLKTPADLAHHTLLTTDTPPGMPPHDHLLALDWKPWFQASGLAGMRMKNTLRFSQYSDVVAAAVAGQGVAIGRLPLLAELLRDGRLVAPFSGAASRLGYFVRLSERGAGNPNARAFVDWLLAQQHA